MTNNISNAIKMVKMLFVRWQQQLHDHLPFSFTSDTPIFSDWVKGLDDHWGILWATGTRAGWVLLEINTLTRSWLQSASYPVSSCKCPAIKPSCYFPWGGLVEAGARIHASDIFGLMLTGVIRWSENSIICTAVPVVFSLLLLVLLTRTVSLVQQCQWCFCYFY